MCMPYCSHSENSQILQMTILQMFASDMETYGRLVQTKEQLGSEVENILFNERCSCGKV
jgi:hypothetical protein